MTHFPLNDELIDVIISGMDKHGQTLKWRKKQYTNTLVQARQPHRRLTQFQQVHWFNELDNALVRRSKMKSELLICH